MFDTVLVANRGEIARRILRACRELGVRSVAVHSDADTGAPYTRDADQVVRLGPAEPARSYLDIDRILEVASKTGADAIHPGYGFLAENARFAEAVAKAGLTFIGPSPKAMGLLGDKVEARKLAMKEDVPVAPGTEGGLADVDEALEIAKDIGYPVILKAAAGGGGMGMRVVREGDEMREAFEAASSQAKAAFGNGAMLLEKFLERPRHIEVQLLGAGDDVLHLGERECSIQRRHQKVLEEAPSPALTEAQRGEVAALAVRLAEAAGYRNAGTAEFLYQDGHFYFNEVNTRLQVEHPVTEMVTGIDLVQAQLRAACGESVGFTQDDVQWHGHAIELRLNAEDPYENFLPRLGTIDHITWPTGEGVRVDHGIAPGWRVPAEYDSLLAKLIVWGRDRGEAIRRLSAALAQTRIGATTNIPLHRRILADEAFLAGELSTRFLEERGILEQLVKEGNEVRAAQRKRAAALAAALTMAPRGGVGLLYHRHARPRRVDEEVA